MEFEDRYNHLPKPKYECLLFDVDDTLYPLHSGLSDECTKNIVEYMVNKLGIKEDNVLELCNQLYKDYGTTMAGLRALGYDFDYDDFHSFVHGRLPYDQIIKPNPVLKSLLQSLPIRKIIFSNGDREHIAQVLSRLGLEDCFEGVICFETLNPINKSNISDDKVDSETRGSSTETQVIGNYCKPNAVLPKSPIVCKPFGHVFEQAFEIANINPQKTLFFDDSIRNLQTGKRMGLHTAWVGSSHKTECVDYALESLHNMREALGELWEAVEKAEDIQSYSRKVAVEASVRA